MPLKRPLTSDRMRRRTKRDTLNFSFVQQWAISLYDCRIVEFWPCHHIWNLLRGREGVLGTRCVARGGSTLDGDGWEAERESEEETGMPLHSFFKGLLKMAVDVEM